MGNRIDTRGHLSCKQLCHTQMCFFVCWLQADRQEALVRAEQRRMAIERANKVLFDATDDVKALHSKLLLSEVSCTPLRGP